MKLTTSTTCFLMATLISLIWLPLQAKTLTGQATSASDDKSLTIQNPWEVSIATSKPTYMVNDPIQINYHTNRASYVYVFYIDAQHSTATQLLTNPSHKLTMVAANEDSALLKTKVTSDKPGIEQLVVVSSKMPLKWDAAKLVSSGDFMNGNLTDFETQIKSFDSRPQSTTAAPSENDVVITRLSIHITAKQPSLIESITAQLSSAIPPAIPASNIAFVATDRRWYKDSDSMIILYGADTDGFVHLFITDPAGQIQPIGKHPVKAGVVNKLSAQIIGSTGRNMLLAAWSIDGKFPESKIVGQLRLEKSKGLLFDAAPDANVLYNLSYFDVK